MNSTILKSICDPKKPLSLHCNIPMTIVNKFSDITGYGTVWYYEDGTANILSLTNVRISSDL